MNLSIGVEAAFEKTSITVDCSGAVQCTASGLARPAKRRLCDACLVSSDTVQISVDPSLLNKRMSLGTGRLILLPLNSGISLSLAGQNFGVCG